MYKLNDSAGYVLNFEVYVKGAHPPSPRGAIHDTIARLLLPSDGPAPLRKTDSGTFKPYDLYADNYYGSIPTAMWLRGHGIGFTSILRTNRAGIPPDFLKDDPKAKGDWTWRLRNDNLVGITKWKDLSSTVIFVSTSQPPTTPFGEHKTLGRWQKGKTVKTMITAPPPAVAYRQYMGSVCILPFVSLICSQVDRNDQALGYHTVCYAAVDTRVVLTCVQKHRQYRKWTHTLMFYLFNMAKVNAWTIYQRRLRPRSRERFDLLQFQWWAIVCCSFLNVSRNLGLASILPHMVLKASGDERLQRAYRDQYRPWSSGKDHCPVKILETDETEDVGDEPACKKPRYGCPYLEKITDKRGRKCANPACKQRPTFQCQGCGRVVCGAGDCNPKIHYE